MLDQAADARDRALEAGAGAVLFEGDVATSEFDAGQEVAAEVADELVRVAELEDGFAGVARVEVDGARVDERVVRAARERQVDAVVDDDVAEEVGLAVDDVHLAGVAPGVDLDLRAAAVVDHGRSQELERGAGGTGEVGRQRAGVVLQDGEGAVVADEDVLLAEALDVRDEGAALDFRVVVGAVLQQEDERTTAGLDDAAAGDSRVEVGAVDAAVVVTVAAGGVLVDRQGIAVEVKVGAIARAGDDEFTLVVHVGRRADGVGGGEDLARARGADVGRAFGLEREVGLEIADRLVADEHDFGAGASDARELTRSVGGDRQRTRIREQGRAVIDAWVIAGIGGRFLITDVRAAPRKAQSAFRRGGRIGIAVVLSARDVEGAAVREGQARRAGEHRATAAGDEVAGHAGIVEDGQRAGPRLDDLTRAGEDADGAIEALIDMDAETVVVIRTGRDRRLELVVVVARLEVVEEVQPEGAADVHRGVGEADFGRTIEDHGRDAGHALGQVVAERRGIDYARGDVRGLQRNFVLGPDRQDVAVDGGAEIVPHVEVAAHHEQAAVHAHLALQAGEALAVGAIIGDQGGRQVARADAVTGRVRAREAEHRAEDGLDVGIRAGVRVVVEHAAGVALILQDGAAGLGDVAIALESTGNRGSDEAFQVDRGVGVHRGDRTAEARRVAQRQERLSGNRAGNPRHGEGDVADLEGAVRGGRVRGVDQSPGQIDILEICGGRLDARSEGTRKQAVARRLETERLGLARDDVRIDEDVVRRARSERRAGVGEEQIGRIRQAGTGDRHLRRQVRGAPVVVRRGGGVPLVPNPRAAIAGGADPGGLGHVLLGLGDACGSKHSGGHQQRLRNPHGEGSG